MSAATVLCRAKDEDGLPCCEREHGVIVMPCKHLALCTQCNPARCPLCYQVVWKPAFLSRTSFVIYPGPDSPHPAPGREKL